MATTDLLHKNLTDPQLHEPKGVAAASENTVYFANGKGTGAWKPVTFDLLKFNKTPVKSATLEEFVLTDPLELSFAGVPGTDIKSTGAVTTDNNMYRVVKEIEKIRETILANQANITALNKTVEDLKKALVQLGVIVNG